MQGRNGDADVEKELADTEWEEEGDSGELFGGKRLGRKTSKPSAFISYY